MGKLGAFIFCLVVIACIAYSEADNRERRRTRIQHRGGRKPGECINSSPKCEEWAKNGLCKKRARLVRRQCRLACELCESNPDDDSGSSEEKEETGPTIINNYIVSAPKEPEPTTTTEAALVEESVPTNTSPTSI